MLSRNVLLLLGSLALAAQAAEVYRWVDDQGRVVYGNTVPDNYKKTAKKVEVGESGPAPAVRTDQPEPKATKAAPVQAQPAPQKPREAVRAGNTANCAELMRRYQESLACFEPFRTQDGGIRQEAFLDRRHRVGTRQHETVENRRNAGRSGREIRPHAGPDGAAEPEDLLYLQLIFAAGPHKHERY